MMLLAQSDHRTQCFATAQDAWFWTMAALRGRREGTGGGGQGVCRPCDPDDVILCLDRLYRRRRIDSSHVTVLRVWGERQMPPLAGRRGADDARLWQEAMACLAPALRAKAIVK